VTDAKTLGETTTAGPAVDDCPAGQRHPWLGLSAVLAGTFIVVLNFFMVNVAIPATQTQLRASSAQIQWVVAGYGLAFAAGMIPAGRLGDLYGRKRMYVLGLVLAIVTSVVCGIAPTATTLVVARVVQGAAAALLSPQVLAIIGVVYKGAMRVRAFTGYGLVFAIASVGGQLIGGALIQADVAGLSWRSCYLINAPIGIAALLLTLWLVPESRMGGRAQLDLVGSVLVTLGLLAVVLPLVEGREVGWPPWVWVCLAMSVPLLAGFALYQHWLSRRGGTPLLDLSLFRLRAFTAGILVTLLFWAGMASFFLVLALYLQQGHGLTPLDSGLLFTVIGVGYAVTSAFAPRLARRIGRQTLALGALGIIVGLVLLLVASLRIGATGSELELIPGLLVDGAGMGLIIAPLNSTVLAGIPGDLAGAASGVLATMIQAGNAVGVAVIGVIFYGVLGRATSAGAYTNAFVASVAGMVVLAVAVVALVQLLPRTRSA
jgi:EmrB/QacA subfamily drug resistance transporter